MTTPQIIVPPQSTDPEEVRRFFEQVCDVINTMVCEAQADSTATDVAGIVADHNTLLANLRNSIIK